VARTTLIIDAAAGGPRAGVFVGKGPVPAAFKSAGTPAHGAGGEALRHALPALVASLKEAGFASFDDVYLSIPAHEMSIRMISIPFGNRDKLRAALPYEISGLLPFDAADAVMDALVTAERGGNAGANVMAFAVEKKTLRDYIEALGSSGLRPAWIGPAAASGPALLTELKAMGAKAALVTSDSLTVSDGGRLGYLRPVRGPECVRLGFGYLESEGVLVEDVYFLGRDPGEMKAVTPEGARTHALTLPGGLGPEAASVMALWADIRRGALKETVNFMRGEFEDARGKEAMRRALRLTFAVLAVLACISGADLYIRYLTLSGEAASYRTALRDSYLRLFPGEKNVADELYQLEAKLKALDREAALTAGPGVLRVVKGLAEAGMRGHGVRFSEVTMAEGRVTARGEADSFEGADRLKGEILKDPLFKDALISDVRAASGRGALFSVSITLR
jgi:type II secretion system protein L